MTKAQQRSIGRFAYAGLAACLLMLLIIGSISIWSHIKFQKDFEWVIQAHEAKQEIAQLLSNMQDAETGARGFVLTGREQYLEPVESARSQINRDFLEMGEATADDPQQRERLTALELLIHEKMNIVNQLIDTRRGAGFEAALQIMLSDKGKLVMNDIRRVVQEMNTAEEQLLEQRNQSVVISARTTSLTMIAGIALIVAIGVIITVRMNRDIEARRLAEEAMRHTHNQLAEQTEILGSVLRCMGDGVVVADTNGKFLIWNPAAARLLGQGAVDLSPDHWTETYGVYLSDGQTPCPVDQLPLVRAIRGEAVDGVILFHKGEKLTVGRWLSITARPLTDQTGKIRGGIVVFNDITEQKHIAEDLKQAKEAADAASQAKSEFLASMSHELRTPLNGVIGMTELLLRSELSGEQRRYAWLAKSSGDMLLSLINDILDLSKIEAGRLDLEAIGFDLHYAIENVAACLSSRAQGKGLELVCGVHSGVPRWVEGDPGRLQQIMTNLVGNAIKFTEHGEIVIRVTAHEETEDDVAVRFSVTDTGIGIPPERIDKLFKTFSQVDSSTTRKYGGTGLGLSISKQLVEAMGGQIDLSSVEGRGSTFSFAIRFAKQPQQVRSMPELSDDIRSVRVLVVDDNATNREILHELLSGWGLDHEMSASGPDALSALRAAQSEGRPFGIAILDRQMPEMDGEKLAREIKKDPTLADTVLVLLTSGIDCSNSKELTDVGFAGWLSKPARSSQLLDTLTEAFVGTKVGSMRTLPPETQRGPSRPPIKKARSAGARVLLAEDHDISQEVASTILRRAGFECDVVGNGKDAVEAAKSGKYDLILMDCQMPDMDGFQATQAIRCGEKKRVFSKRAKARIPIIALTANVIQGDRERCLAAGMDDYASKPLDAERLLRLIDAHLGHPERNSTESDQSAQMATKAPPEQVLDGEPSAIDGKKMLQRWNNDELFVRRLITKFSARAPDDLRRLREAIERSDANETRRLAHGLKGAAGYVAAEKVFQLAAQLETMARETDLSRAAACLQELAAELQRCTNESSEGTAADETQTMVAHPKIEGTA